MDAAGDGARSFSSASLVVGQIVEPLLFRLADPSVAAGGAARNRVLDLPVGAGRPGAGGAADPRGRRDGEGNTVPRLEFLRILLGNEPVSAGARGAPLSPVAGWGSDPGRQGRSTNGSASRHSRNISMSSRSRQPASRPTIRNALRSAAEQMNGLNETIAGIYRAQVKEELPRFQARAAGGRDRHAKPDTARRLGDCAGPRRTRKPRPRRLGTDCRRHSARPWNRRPVPVARRLDRH